MDHRQTARPASSGSETSDAKPRTKAYLVGGGIASMAAAAFLIRDGDVRGCDITILEETDRLPRALIF